MELCGVRFALLLAVAYATSFAEVAPTVPNLWKPNKQILPRLLLPKNRNGSRQANKQILPRLQLPKNRNGSRQAGKTNVFGRKKINDMEKKRAKSLRYFRTEPSTNGKLRLVFVPESFEKKVKLPLIRPSGTQWLDPGTIRLFAENVLKHSSAKGGVYESGLLAALQLIACHETLEEATKCFFKLGAKGRFFSTLDDNGVEKQRIDYRGRVVRDVLDGLKSGVEGTDLFSRTNVFLWLSRNGFGYIPGNLSWIGPAVVTGLFALVAAAIIILGFVGGFWGEKRRLLVTTVFVVVTCSLYAVYSVFKVTGYELFLSTPLVPNIQQYQVHIVERLASVFSLITVALFSYIIFSALVSMFFSHHAKVLRIGTVVVFSVITFIAGAYGIGMVIYDSAARAVFVVDASIALLSGCLLLFSVFLLAVLVIVARKVATSEKVTESARGKLGRNSLLFLAVAVFVFAIHLTLFLFSVLLLTVSYAQFALPYAILQTLSVVVICLTVIIYAGVGVLSVLKRKKHMALEDFSTKSSSEESMVVPARYAEY